MPDISKIIATPISLISKLGPVQKSAMAGIFRSQYTIPSAGKNVTYVDSMLRVNDSTSSFNVEESTQLIFDLSDSSNSGHPFTLATANDESTNYANVTSSGTPGQAGATLTTTLPAYSSNQTLWWYCSNHSSEGASFAITEAQVSGWDSQAGVILLTPSTAFHTPGSGAYMHVFQDGSQNSSPSAAQSLAAINQASGSSDGDTSYIRYPNSNTGGWYFASPIIYKITATTRLDSGGQIVPYGSWTSPWKNGYNTYSNNGDGSTAWTKDDLDDIYIGIESKYADIWFSFDREAHTNTEEDVPDSATISKIEVHAQVKGSYYQSYKGVKQHGYVTQVFGLVYYS